MADLPISVRRIPFNMAVCNLSLRYQTDWYNRLQISIIPLPESLPLFMATSMFPLTQTASDHCSFYSNSLLSPLLAMLINCSFLCYLVDSVPYLNIFVPTFEFQLSTSSMKFIQEDDDWADRAAEWLEFSKMPQPGYQRERGSDKLSTTEETWPLFDSGPLERRSNI